MIFKSYLVEENLNKLQNSLTLFYGENEGLIEEFKNKITLFYKKFKILRLTQEEILKNNNLLFNELQNLSLFEEKKILFIQNANDKILNIIDEAQDLIKDNKIYIFSSILEKRSKLRNFFEKHKQVDIIPCYKDNDLTIRKLITSSLKDFNNISNQVINIIKESCSNDRFKINNEIEKIKNYFLTNKINTDDLLKLLNLKSDDEFDIIRDYAFSGDKLKTNNLINSTLIDSDKSAYYLTIINQRLLKLKIVYSDKPKNLNKAIDELKPPIFWKDKPTFIKHANLWNEEKINNTLDKTYFVEVQIKSNPVIEKKLLIKKLLIDICNNANAA